MINSWMFSKVSWVCLWWFANLGFMIFSLISVDILHRYLREPWIGTRTNLDWTGCQMWDEERLFSAATAKFLIFTKSSYECFLWFSLENVFLWFSLENVFCLHNIGAAQASQLRALGCRSGGGTELIQQWAETACVGWRELSRAEKATFVETTVLLFSPASFFGSQKISQWSLTKFEYFGLFRENSTLWGCYR